MISTDTKGKKKTGICQCFFCRAWRADSQRRRWDAGVVDILRSNEPRSNARGTREHISKRQKKLRGVEAPLQWILLDSRLETGPCAGGDLVGAGGWFWASRKPRPASSSPSFLLSVLCTFPAPPRRGTNERRFTAPSVRAGWSRDMGNISSGRLFSESRAGHTSVLCAFRGSVFDMRKEREYGVLTSILPYREIHTRSTNYAAAFKNNYLLCTCRIRAFNALFLPIQRAHAFLTYTYTPLSQLPQTTTPFFLLPSFFSCHLILATGFNGVRCCVPRSLTCPLVLSGSPAVPAHQTTRLALLVGGGGRGQPLICPGPASVPTKKSICSALSTPVSFRHYLTVSLAAAPGLRTKTKNKSMANQAWPT